MSASLSVSLSVSAREKSRSRPSFEGKLILQSNLEKMMVNVSYDLVVRVVEELSELYNFESTEALELLNLDGITLEKRSLDKRSLEKRVDKKSEKRVEKAKKRAFQLPFHVKEENCCGLKFAQGLFVQCHMRKVESSSYCEGCSSEASKNANGKPVNGTVEDRLSCDLMAYKSPLGRQVVPYAKWMLKHNLTRSQVTEEAARLGLEIDEGHFEMPLSSEAKKGRPKSEKVSEESSSSEKKKGRPKKSKKVLEIETSDIFAELVAAATSSSECESEEESESELECESASVVSKVSEKSELSEMKKADKESKESEKMVSKEAEKKKKEEEKAAKEAEKEAKKEAEKAAKEAKEAEKKKKEEEKAAKEAEKKKKEEEKAAKEEEKKKKEEEKAAKEAEKKKKEEEKVVKEVEKKKKNEKASNKKEEVEVVEEPIKVVIINAKGQTKKTGLQEGEKKFLRSSKGEILDFKTQDTIGKWNAAESRIEFNEDYVESDDEDEEEEEEYDE